MSFRDRADAARQLAKKLGAYRQRADVIVVGLARGGVVTAEAVSYALGVDMDVVVVRKVGAPGQEELAIGAVAQGGIVVCNNELCLQMGIGKKQFDALAQKEQAECARRVALYQGHGAGRDWKNKTVILVDDGIATGMTMEAAIKTARAAGAAGVVVAVPVLPADSVDGMRRLADELVFLEAPESFLSVGSFYADFDQVEHEQVITLLQVAARRPSRRAPQL